MYTCLHVRRSIGQIEKKTECVEQDQIVGVRGFKEVIVLVGSSHLEAAVTLGQMFHDRDYHWYYYFKRLTEFRL